MNKNYYITSRKISTIANEYVFLLKLVLYYH